MSLVNFPPFPKKIDPSLLAPQSFPVGSTDDAGQVYIVEPLFALPSLTQARRRVVADCLARAHGVPLVSSINPNMMSLAGVSQSMIWQARDRLSHEIKDCLRRLGIRLSYADMLDGDSIHSFHDIAQRLSDHHVVSCRDDVTFYNITKKTVVPDHRVVQEMRKGIRYHMRFFVEAKKHSIVASLDEPCFLFACVAILVHPLDKRYKKLIGKDVIVPLINKAIPLLAHESVSMEGNGTVMLIPAHKREDYHLALEMGLPTDIYAVDQYGCFTTHAKDFAGKSIISFRENIIQFLDDISNIDLKEYITIPTFVDSQTGDMLLSILQKNIFFSLYADTLQTVLSDESIVLRSCPDTLLDTLAGHDSRWCISGKNTMQAQVAYTIDKQNELQPLSFSTNMPLLTCIVADAMMMGICPSPVRFDTLIESLLVDYNDHRLVDHLLSYYETYHPALYTHDKGDKIRQLFVGLADDDDKIMKHSDDLLHRLETSDGIVCTDQGYIVTLPTHDYSYDHEYIGLTQIIATLSHLSAPRQISYFFTLDESHWLTHLLLLIYHMGDRHADVLIPYTTIASLIHVAGSDQILDDHYMKQLDLYGGDVIRLSLLLTSSVMDEEAIPSYSLDTLHRFIHKRWNASRFMTMTYRSSDIFASSLTLSSTLTQYADQFTEYDIWIITNIQRIVKDVLYYRERYAIATSVHICIQSLWHDMTEIAFTIAKDYSSPATPLLCALAIHAGCLLLQPYTPYTVGSLLSCISRGDKDMSLDEILALEYTKNYKCTLMMDVVRQRMILLSQVPAGVTSITLYLQANKDFSDYVSRHEEFVLRCFPQATIQYVSENDVLPDAITQSRIMNVVAGIETKIKEPEPVVSLSVLTGQHAYKKQLIQTLRNTIMRLRQSKSPDNAEQITSLEEQITQLQKDIEKLDYDIAKMKYYKN